jgi:hypothetical protein
VPCKQSAKIVTGSKEPDDSLEKLSNYEFENEFSGQNVPLENELNRFAIASSLIRTVLTDPETSSG